MCTQKMRALSYIGAEKISFPLNVVDGQTDIHLYLYSSFATNKIRGGEVQCSTGKTRESTIPTTSIILRKNKIDIG